MALRVGIIGTGWIGRQHLGVLASLDDVEVAALCDLDEARVQPLAKEVSATAYNDWRRMLDEARLDAVWVCTPPLEHIAPAEAALRGGLPVYLEKPIARTLDDAASIVETAQSTGQVCAVGYQWHSLDLLEDVRELLVHEEIGFLVGANVGSTESRPWFLDRRMGGGNLLERGSHHIDLARTLAGEVGAVQAAASGVWLARAGRPDGEGAPGSKGAPGDKKGGDIEDALTVLLQMDSGALATIVVAWTRPGQPGNYTLDVLATGSTLRLDLDPNFTLSGQHGDEIVSRQSTVHPFESSIRRFLDAAERQEPAAVACAPRDAAATLAAAVAAERALETGGTIEVRTSVG